MFPDLFSLLPHYYNYSRKRSNDSDDRQNKLCVDLKGEKIWIQYDGTEVGVANELVEQGIPKDAIVLAYHSPFLRQYDGFAVN